MGELRFVARLCNDLPAPAPPDLRQRAAQHKKRPHQAAFLAG